MKFKQERVYPVYTEVKAICNDCGGEYERYGSEVYLSFPAQYLYKCNGCDKQKLLYEDEQPGIKTTWVSKKQFDEIGNNTLCSY